MKLLVGVILCCLVLVGPANADFTGNDLHTLCTLDTEKTKTACRMWITGFLNGLTMAQVLSKQQNKEPVTCIPNGVTGDQARMIVEKYMRDRPNVLHLSGEPIAAFALTRAFPCKD